MDWQRLARANTHPLRISVMEVLAMDGGRTLSPSDLSYELRVPAEQRQLPRHRAAALGPDRARQRAPGARRDRALLPRWSTTSHCPQRRTVPRGRPNGNGHAGRAAADPRSGRRVSNPRPRAWEARALPTELRPRGGDSTAGEAPGSNLPVPMSARTILALLAVCAVIGLLVFGLLSKGTAKIAVGDPVPDKVAAGARRQRPGHDRRLPRRMGPGQPLGLLVPALPRGGAGRSRTCTAGNRGRRRDRARHQRPGQQRATRSPSSTSSSPTYPQLRSVGDDRSEAFGSTGVPENFLVNPKGKLALIWRGPVDESILEDSVDPIVEGS